MIFKYMSLDFKKAQAKDEFKLAFLRFNALEFIGEVKNSL